MSEVGLIAPILVVGVHIMHTSVVSASVRLLGLGLLLDGVGGPLVHPLPGGLLPLPVGHLLHKGLGGGDGHPVSVVDRNVEELASSVGITELEVPGLQQKS